MHNSNNKNYSKKQSRKKFFYLFLLSIILLTLLLVFYIFTHIKHNNISAKFLAQQELSNFKLKSTKKLIKVKFTQNKIPTKINYYFLYFKNFNDLQAAQLLQKQLLQQNYKAVIKINQAKLLLYTVYLKFNTQKEAMKAQQKLTKNNFYSVLVAE